MREGRELRARKRSECESAPCTGTTERSCFPRLLTLAALHPSGSSRSSGPIAAHRQRRAVDRVRRAHAQVQSQPLERERTSRFLRPRAASRPSSVSCRVHFNSVTQRTNDEVCERAKRDYERAPLRPSREVGDVPARLLNPRQRALVFAPLARLVAHRRRRSEGEVSRARSS